MANKEIGDLTAAAALTGDEEVHALQGANSRRLKLPGTWRLHDTWDHAVDGDSASAAFTGLAGAQDILIEADDVTKSVSGLLNLELSTDNGSTYRATVGDYEQVAEAGTVTAAAAAANLHVTNATGARSGAAIIHAANVSGAPKVIEAINRVSDNRMRYFLQSLDPVNACQVVPSAGGNLTGGKIYCLVRGKAAT